METSFMNGILLSRFVSEMGKQQIGLYGITRATTVLQPHCSVNLPNKNTRHTRGTTPHPTDLVMYLPKNRRISASSTTIYHPTVTRDLNQYRIYT